jgi:oxygen-independent coproporphyrinogen-3 oxidase
MLDRGELPLGRALPVSRRELLIREVILQLKTGRLDAEYFRGKFDTDIRLAFAAGFDQLRRDGYLTDQDGQLALTRNGLLEVDRLLPVFFEPQHRTTRYT